MLTLEEVRERLAALEAHDVDGPTRYRYEREEEALRTAEAALRDEAWFEERYRALADALRGMPLSNRTGP